MARGRVREFECYMCRSQLKSQYCLKKHMIELHTGHRPFKCHMCPAAFPYKKALPAHIRSHTVPFECHKCRARFANMAELKAHLAVQVCRVCKLMVNGRCEMVYHRSSHKNEAYECLWCKKKFPRRPYMVEHVKFHHTNDMKFACCYCGKRFLNRGRLNIHISIHTGNKKFVCIICAAKFPTRSQLKTHERVHSNERPYSCSICAKKFKRSDHRTNHMSTHTIHKPFSCIICGRKFTRDSHRRIHIKNMHKNVNTTHTVVEDYSELSENMLFECIVCHVRFDSVHMLEEHMTNLH